MARLIIRLAWLWMILIGYILITPIGPICIACGVTDPAHISNQPRWCSALLLSPLG